MQSIFRASELYSAASEACGCVDPACGLIMIPRCHQNAGCRVKFFKMTRTLDINCVVCDALVARITDIDGSVPVQS